MVRFQLIITPEQINEQLDLLAREINKYYRNDNPYFLIVADGGIPFAMDLLLRLGDMDMKFKYSCIKCSSYGDKTSGPPTVDFDPNVLPKDLKNSKVIILDDIADTMETLNRIKTAVEDLGNDVETCVCINKLINRTEMWEPDYYCFCGAYDYWLVGYGLDFKGYCRTWNGIYIPEGSTAD